MTYRGLGFDPTPGDLGAVGQAAAQLVAAADALAEVGPAQRRASEHAQPWHGSAADAFRSRLHEPPSGTLEPRLRRAAAALDRWAATLAANRHRAEELDAQAVRLRRRLADARDLLQDKQNARDLASTGATVTAAEADLAAASGLVADLESTLDKLLERARALQGDHQRAADAIADELAGAETPGQARESAVGRTVAEALRLASQTSGALGSLLLPPNRDEAAVPTGAAGALAAALFASGPR